VTGAVLPTFQKIIVHHQPICRISKTGEIAPYQPSNRNKGFEFAGFEKLSALNG
jgi:hypothetical protein